MRANPANDIARRRLRDLPHAARAAAEARGDVPGDEEWEELVERDPAHLARLYDSGTENWRAFLDVLIELAPSRLTYPQIEDRLGWDRGRLGNVIGGSRSADGMATRPYHVSSDAPTRFTTTTRTSCRV